MYKEQETTLTLSGSAETKEEAFNRIFSQIKMELSKRIPGLLIRIEPMDIEIVSAIETVYTERLFGLFFPRKRTRYQIKADVTVRIRIIDLADVSFERDEEKPTPIQRILNLR